MTSLAWDSHLHLHSTEDHDAISEGVEYFSTLPPITEYKIIDTIDHFNNENNGKIQINKCAKIPERLENLLRDQCDGITFEQCQKSVQELWKTHSIKNKLEVMVEESEYSYQLFETRMKSLAIFHHFSSRGKQGVNGINGKSGKDGRFGSK